MNLHFTKIPNQFHELNTGELWDGRLKLGRIIFDAIQGSNTIGQYLIILSSRITLSIEDLQQLEKFLRNHDNERQ